MTFWNLCRQLEGDGNVKSVPKEQDFGFGDATFPTSGPSVFDAPTFKQWGPSPATGAQQQLPPLAEDGLGVPFHDAAPTNQAPPKSSNGGKGT